jgi:hypothetical protein
MNANAITRIEEGTDVGHEASKFTINVIMTAAALIGLWGTACLIGGLVTNGVGGMLAGYLTALGL